MSLDFSELGSGAMPSGAHTSKSAKNYVNQPDVELSWAMKAFAHAETYFSLVTSMDPSFLKLTSQDDAIYKQFREEFPELKIDILVEDDLKSATAKAKWRPFCEAFKELTEDYNFGTLVRLDTTKDYSEDNTILVLRIQFLAIEIARNREQHNTELRFLHGKQKKDEETS